MVTCLPHLTPEADEPGSRLPAGGGRRCSRQPLDQGVADAAQLGALQAPQLPAPPHVRLDQADEAEPLPAYSPVGQGSAVEADPLPAPPRGAQDGGADAAHLPAQRRPQPRSSSRGSCILHTRTHTAVYVCTF